MRINAYILAADPAWIEHSVLSYYALVDELIVSYDQAGMSWTGVPIAVEECLARVKAIDTQGKCRYVGGHFARLDCDPMANDTYQRQCALAAAGRDAQWVLQLDTDEIVGDAGRLAEELARIPADCNALDWPMRTFFQKAANGRYLEVCSLLGRPVASYPGPVAVRPGMVLQHARQAAAARAWRVDFRARDTDPAAGNRRVDCVIAKDAGIMHMSWVRSETEVLQKVRAWGHSAQFDGAGFIQRVWKKAPRHWRWMFHFHPLTPRWWPALRAVDLGASFAAGGAMAGGTTR